MVKFKLNKLILNKAHSYKRKRHNSQLYYDNYDVYFYLTCVITATNITIKP